MIPRRLAPGAGRLAVLAASALLLVLAGSVRSLAAQGTGTGTGTEAPAAPRKKKKKTAGEKIEEALKIILTPPDSARRSGSTPAASPAGTTGRMIRDLTITPEGEDTLSARFRLDQQDTVPRRSTRACGPARACVTGWDLALAGVSVPGPEVPQGTPLPVTVAVENRGRVASPVSELMLCLGEVWSDGYQCAQRGAVVTLPALAPGETIRLVLGFPLDQQRHEGTVIAVVDPDSATTERNRANNVRPSTRFATVLAEYQWLGVEIPPTGRAGQPVPVTLRIRNKSWAATTPQVEFLVGGGPGCQYGHDSEHRLTVPPIGPRQTVMVRFKVVDAAKMNVDYCSTEPRQMLLIVDPDNRHQWGPAHERSWDRVFVIR